MPTLDFRGRPITGLIGEQPDGKPPKAVLDDWMHKVGPSVEDPTLPRYWFWNGVKTYASYGDYVD